MPLPHDDDDLCRTWVGNLQAGRDQDESSRLLYEKFAEMVFRYLLHLSGSKLDAEDTTQEVFLSFFRGIGAFRYDSPWSLKAWILTTAKNQWKNRVRAERTVKREALRVPTRSTEDESRAGVVLEDLTAEGPNPLEFLEEAERTRFLHAAIATLSPQRRRCCELRYVHGLKYREIAAILNVSIETIKAHLHQAKTHLEAAIEAARGGLKPDDPGKEGKQ